MASLLDRFRRSRVAPQKTFGASGVGVFGGHIEEKEKNAALAGSTKYTTYSNILSNVSIVAAGTRYFLNLLSSANWGVQPSETENDNEQGEAERQAELVESMMRDMLTPWHRVVRRAAMFRYYGFSVQEWTAKRRSDGVLGFLDVAPRPQSTIERWDVDSTGAVQGIIQRNPQNSQEVYLPRAKVVYVVDDSLNDSPEGLGIFRNIVEASTRLARYEQLEGFGFETDLRGIPIARIPYAKLEEAVKSGTMDADTAKEHIKAMETFVEKHVKNPALGLTMDSVPYMGQDDAARPVAAAPQWDVKLLSGDGGDFESVGAAIERINHEIARVLGVEQLLLGQTRGTQALSSDKSNNFGLIIDSTLLELQETFNRDYIRVIAELNGWNTDFLPEFRVDKVRQRDIEEITSALKDMATAGVLLAEDDPVINEVRDLMGVSRPITVRTTESAANDDPEGGEIEEEESEEDED